MTFICFFGIKKETFRIGHSVLPKFFLEDVGNEGFDMVMKFDRKIGISDLPQVMVEEFLRYYLGVDAVIGRELKEFKGYFLGIMEEKKKPRDMLNHILGEQSNDVVGIGCFNRCLDYQLFSYCKVVHLMTEAEKLTWKTLPRKKYPKALVFHDGRLAFRPTPLDTLTMFMWIPIGLIIALIRFSTAMLLPYKLQISIMCFTGMTGELLENSKKDPKNPKEKNTLYVSNHKTLMDPLYVSISLGKSIPAVTYSLSKFVEFVAPIKTVRLTRNREKDSEIIRKLLKQDDLLIFPEGTTCREPYLLRFSPLFAEMSDEIVPIGTDLNVSMFYATTASGHKFMDPLFLILNPKTYTIVKILDKLPKAFTCTSGGKSNIEVANYLQAEIAKAMEFESTCFTRKDKYMMLAGNNGIV
ncbi:hypothetical protein ACFE04_012804 [Oxalis oulophora]